MCAKAHGFAWILFIMDLDYSWTYYVFHCIDSHTLSITIPSWNLWFEPGNHQIGSTMENIPSKGVSFSDFICIFAMSFDKFAVFLFFNTKASEFFDITTPWATYYCSRHYK